MALSKLSISIASLVAAFGISGLAHADFVKTVGSEGQCVSQDGSVMDLNGTKYCLVAVIPAEFQVGEYAGELKGVTECPEKSVRKTSIGDFCLVALEPVKAVTPVTTDSVINTTTETTAEQPMTRAEKRAAKKAEKAAREAAEASLATVDGN